MRRPRQRSDEAQRRAHRRPWRRRRAANEPVISCVRRMNTSPIAPIGRRPISEAANGAAAPDCRSAEKKPRRGRSRDGDIVVISVARSPLHQKRFGEDRIIRHTERVIAYRFRPRGPLPHALRDLAVVRACRRACWCCVTPARTPCHLPWVRAARERLDGLRLRDARRAGSRPRLCARLLRAAAALAAARRHRGARARAHGPTRRRRAASSGGASAAACRPWCGRWRTTWCAASTRLVDTMSGLLGTGARSRGGITCGRCSRRTSATAPGGFAGAVRSSCSRGSTVACAGAPARSRSRRLPTRSWSWAGAGCSSCPRCSCGRAPARCSTRRGSRA